MLASVQIPCDYPAKYETQKLYLSTELLYAALTSNTQTHGIYQWIGHNNE